MILNWGLLGSTQFAIKPLTLLMFKTNTVLCVLTIIRIYFADYSPSSFCFMNSSGLIKLSSNALGGIDAILGIYIFFSF